MTSLATAFTAAGAQSAADLTRERRLDDVLGAVALVLVLRALDEEHMARLGEVPRQILGPAILAAIDSGGSLDEATAAVIAAMEGD